MSKKTVYLVRHGQSEGNRDGIIQGHANAPLTHLGKEQANAVGQWFSANVDGVSHIYTSDLERAHDTGKAIAQYLDLTVKVDSDFREANFGKWEGKSADAITQSDPEEFTRWKKERTWRPSWCEQFDDLQDRASRAVYNGLSQSNGDLVVASHGGFIYSLVHKWAPEKTVPIRNCSITKIVFNLSEKGESLYFPEVEMVSYLPDTVPPSPNSSKYYTEIIGDK